MSQPYGRRPRPPQRRPPARGIPPPERAPRPRARPKPRSRFKPVAIGCLAVAVLALVALGYAATRGGSSARPGSPDVYARIAASSDCTALQKEFDQADANGKRDRASGRTEQARWSSGYMDAADARMRQIGCYARKG